MARWSIRRLMLVIAGVAVVLSGLIALSRHENGHRPHCQSSLRNIVLGLLAHAYNKGAFPEATRPNPGLPPEQRLSWYVSLFDYEDLSDLKPHVDEGQPWDSPTNAKLARLRISTFRCPNSYDPPTSHPGATPYIGIAGLGTDAPFLPSGHPRAGVFGHDRRTSLRDIKDGAAVTMVIAESGRIRDSWLAGGPATVRGLDTADRPYIGPGRQFGADHSRPGVNVAFADGSVRFIDGTINPRIFEAFTTIAGGEAIPPTESW